MCKVLVISAYPNRLLAARDLLEHRGFRVLIAGDECAARRTVKREHPDILIISPEIRMVVPSVPAVVRLLEDAEKLLEAVCWAAREAGGRRNGYKRIVRRQSVRT